MNPLHVFPGIRRVFLASAIAVVVPALLGAGTASAAGATTFNPACSVPSLRTALTTAEATPGPHTINLPAACTYRFSDAESVTNPDNALPVLTRDITINGNGAAFERNAGAPPFRFLDMTGNDTLTVRDLTMSYGLNPPPDGVTHAGYTGHSVGGAIRCTSADLTLDGVTFNDNMAEDGGAVFAEGCRTTVTDSTFDHGNASDGDGGALVQVCSGEHDCSLSIMDSLLEDNAASRDGGAVFTSSTSVMIASSTVHRNTAGRDGGGLRVGTSSPFFAEIDFTTIARNTAGGRGGGLFTAAANATYLRYSSVWSNSAQSGGGIAWNNGGVIWLTTISGNSATSAGGAFYQYEPGGTMSLNRDTLADNTAPAAPAIRVTGGELDLINTLVAYTGALPAGQLCDRVGNPIGMLLVTWTQYAQSEGPCFSSTLIGAHGAALQPLDQNGGPTRSHKLGAGSAAKDAGDLAQCTSLDNFTHSDQRGAPYVGINGPTCDVGSIEMQLIVTATPIGIGVFNPLHP